MTKVIQFTNKNWIFYIIVGIWTATNDYCLGRKPPETTRLPLKDFMQGGNMTRLLREKGHPVVEDDQDSVCQASGRVPVDSQIKFKIVNET